MTLRQRLGGDVQRVQTKDTMKLSPSIHITVLSDQTISPEALGYAEQRLFAALMQVAGPDDVRHAGVILRRAKHHCLSPRVTCVVNVGLGGANALRIQAVADDPYTAVDRAVAQLQPATTIAAS
jgi:hypothetical protein